MSKDGNGTTIVVKNDGCSKALGNGCGLIVILNLLLAWLVWHVVTKSVDEIAAEKAERPSPPAVTVSTNGPLP